MEELNVMEMMLSFLIENSAKISAVLTLGGTVGYLALKTAKKVSSKVKPYLEVVDKISHLSVKIDEVSKQLQYDHGFSMRDQIGKIEKTLDRNTKITELIFNRQRWLMDTRNEPMFEADKNGNFTWANTALVRLTKRSINDLLGNKWRNIVSEDRRDDTLFHWDEAVKQKRNFEETLHLTDKVGNKYVTYCIAAIQDDGNYIGTFSNIEKCVDKAGI